MDQKRKWILVDSSIPHSPGGNKKRVVEVYASPSSYDDPSTSGYTRRAIPSHPSESKLHSLNRLNDRIHRKIAANSFLYSSTSSAIREEEVEVPREERGGRGGGGGGHGREEGERIVDESFRFIDDGNIYASSSRFPPSSSLNRLVQHRDSQGEIDAVYERKPRQPDRGASLVADPPLPPSSSSQWMGDPRRLAPDPPSPSKIPMRGDNTDWHHSRPSSVTRHVPITLTREKLRRDVMMDHRLDPLPLPPPSLPRVDQSRRHLDYALLCPFCSTPLLHGADHCEACGAVDTTPLRRLGNRNYEYFPPTTSTLPPPRYARSHSAPDYVRQTTHVVAEPSYYRRREEILNPRTLGRDSHYWATPAAAAAAPPPLAKRSPPSQSTLMRTSRVDPIYRHYGTTDWRRKNYLDAEYHSYPNYRDPAYNLQRSYYRYGHVKPRKSRGHTQRKAIAFALALLSLALVISAGVVLAAINY